MKYIKTFEKFDIPKIKPIPEIGADMTLFNNSEVNIKNYNTKKKQLADIYSNYAEDDNPVQGRMPTDLYNKLLSGKFIKSGNKDNVQFNNPLFAQYSTFCAKQRQVTNIDNNLQNKTKDIEDTKINIQNNVGDRQTNNDTINNLNQDVKNQKTQLNQVEKETKDLQKSSNTQLKNNTKELEDAKKRITTLTSKK